MRSAGLEAAQAVARARRSLNAIIVASRAMAWAAPASLAGGAAALLLRFAGLGRGTGAIILAAAALSGAAAGALRARGALLDDEGAAWWLDAFLGDGDILSADLACRARGYSGRFDAEIADHARAWAARAREVRAPLRGAARRAALAFAAAGACGAFLLLAGPAAPAPALVGAGLAEGASATVEASLESAADLAAGALAAGPSELAASLFPEDRRLATLAERALREGRVEDLADILRKAGLSLEEGADRPLAEREPPGLLKAPPFLADPERGGRAAAGQSSRGYEPRGVEPDVEGADPSGEGGEDTGEGAEPGSPGGPGDRPGEGGLGGEEGRLGEGGSGRPALGGSGWGEGEGAPRDWGELRPTEGAADVALPTGPEAPFFELVLPGRAAAAPLSRLAPAAARGAESAIGRRDLPLEREAYVRDYFLALEKGDDE